MSAITRICNPLTCIFLCVVCCSLIPFLSQLETSPPLVRVLVLESAKNELPAGEVATDNADADADAATATAVSPSRVGGFGYFGYLATSMSSRRDVLDSERHRVGDNWIDWHLAAYNSELGAKGGTDTIGGGNGDDSALTEIWFQANSRTFYGPVIIGQEKECNIPCVWTRNGVGASKRLPDATAFVMDSNYKNIPAFPRHSRRELEGLPAVGITWENHWKGKLPTDTYTTTQLASQRQPSMAQQTRDMKRGMHFDLLASFELNSHVPTIYREFGLLYENHQPVSFETLLAEHKAKHGAMFVAISNCKGVMVPDRVEYLAEVGQIYPLASYGKCLRNETLVGKLPTGRDGDYLRLASTHLFIAAFENSFGIDYATEKLANALRAGSVPVYAGAPNAATFLPHPDAAIHVSDFEGPSELAAYLRRMTDDPPALARKHLMWRTRPLEERYRRLVQFAHASAESSNYTFGCKVCNCVRGKIGCPKIDSGRGKV